MNIISIDTATSHRDGQHLDVTLSGVPNGTLSFVASRSNPPIYGYQAIPYTGTFPNLTLTFPSPYVWYLWAQDRTGLSDSAAVWPNFSDNVALDETGIALEAILENNRKALDLMLRTVYPGASFKQISYGISANILAFPSVLITNPGVKHAPDFASFGWRHDYSFTLAFMVIHQDEQSELRNAVKIAELSAQILNQQAYNRIPLPCGQTLVDCKATQGEYAEFALDDVGWCATGTLVWSGWSLTQDREV
jgi:hypothetical protein